MATPKMQSCNHLMIDIETLGLRTDALVFEIGLAVWNVDTQGMVMSYAATIDPRSQPDRDVDPKTLHWWEGRGYPNHHQDLSGFNETNLDLEEALDRVRNCYKQYQCRCVWSKGPEFDIAILEHAWRQYDQYPPWPYASRRCARTVMALTPVLAPETTAIVNDAPHNPRADAVYQSVLCQQALRRVYRTQPDPL